MYCGVAAAAADISFSGALFLEIRWKAQLYRTAELNVELFDKSDTLLRPMKTDVNGKMRKCRKDFTGNLGSSKQKHKLKTTRLPSSGKI